MAVMDLTAYILGQHYVLLITAGTAMALLDMNAHLLRTIQTCDVDSLSLSLSRLCSATVNNNWYTLN